MSERVGVLGIQYHEDGVPPSQVNPDLLVGPNGAPHLRFVPREISRVIPRMRVAGCRTDALVVPDNWAPQRQQSTTRKKKVEGVA